MRLKLSDWFQIYDVRPLRNGTGGFIVYLCGLAPFAIYSLCHLEDYKVVSEPGETSIRLQPRSVKQ